MQMMGRVLLYKLFKFLEEGMCIYRVISKSIRNQYDLLQRLGQDNPNDYNCCN
jgi:hypothetical protein